MKSFRLSQITSTFLPGVVIFLAFSLGSCAKKIAFQSSVIVPAAEGRVKIKKDNNENYSLDITLRNLVESRKLQPPRNTYVVWSETDRNGIQNIGQINSSSGLFSSTLKASLKAVTPFKPVRIFITAEDDVSIRYPASLVVMTTRSFY